MTKKAMIEALRVFINQRSGIDGRNYGGSREAFMGDYRPMLKHGRQARVMLQAVALRDSLTAEALQAASRAYCGRLQFIERGDKVAVDYTTGQYFPAEYRAAACAVLAQALWDYWREGKGFCGTDTAKEIRKQAARELGRGIAAEWFN